MQNKVFVLPAICLLLSSCVSFKTARGDARKIIVRTAKNLLNKHYAYGRQDSYEGFDCSGLTQFAYLEAGIKIPRTCRAQYDKAAKIPIDRLKPGDLVFFSTYADGPTHVGVYIGDNEFIHSPSEGKKVAVVNMDNSYWKKVFYGAGTYINY
jgi:cell wall-associated NlpC family hydrolase